MRKVEDNNKGFSLVELIVIIAIMAVAIGFAAWSLRLIFGSEARQCATKFSADLNEVKTSSMARYSQSISFGYLDETSGVAVVDSASKAGFYSTKTTYYLTKDASTNMPVKVNDVGASEHRKLGSGKVSVSISYFDGSADVDDEPIDGSNTKSITIFYNRATGLFDGISVNGTEYAGGYPKEITFSYGMKTYKIIFDQETGTHKMERV